MNAGYIGRKMSKRAKHSHDMGQFPITTLDRSMLQKYNFSYSVAFFRWLCQQGYIKYRSRHHTGASFRYTYFYSPASIDFAAKYLRLDLLYEIYLEKLNRKEALQKLGIKCSRIKTLSGLFRNKNNYEVILDVVRYNDYFFLSDTQWISPEENQYSVLSEYDWVPSDEKQWHNENFKKITRKILMFKNIDSLIVQSV